MQIAFHIIYRYEGLLWLSVALVAGAGWWRYRSRSWAIFAVVLLLKSVAWFMSTCPVMFQSGNSMVSAHGIFAEGLNSDPARNAWKVETLGIVDGLIPVLMILGFVVRWFEDKGLPTRPPTLRR
jgi:hypothetical protein